MSTLTDKYGLATPNDVDPVNIRILNANTEKIAQELDKIYAELALIKKALGI